MKKILLLFSLFIVSNLSFSQKLKLVDLKYIYEHNNESTNNYRIKKGFNFYLRKNNELTDITTYSGENQTFVIKYDDLCKYVFYDSKIYSSIREESKKNGFRYVREMTDTPEGSGLTFIFEKGGRNLYFSSINKFNKTKYIISYSGDSPRTHYSFYHLNYF